MRPCTTEKSCLAQENSRNSAGLLAERSGGGFASSPDGPASVLGPMIIYSLHASCRVECETSGLAGRRGPDGGSIGAPRFSVILPDNKTGGHASLTQNPHKSSKLRPGSGRNRAGLHQMAQPFDWEH